MYKEFPDTIATFPFLPAGVSFGYYFFLPWLDIALFEQISFWPYFAMLFTIVITASMITVIKLNHGKYVFEHFSYLLVASVLFIIAGILLVVLREKQTYIAIFISAIATGIVYVAGISYVNIRSEKKQRPVRIASCHAWKAIGFALAYSIYLYLIYDTGSAQPDTLNKFYQIIGYVIIGTSGIFVFLMMVNEYLQRQGLLYNYRDCLDHDNAIANNYCKLFSRNEVIIERNLAVSSNGMWKSTENLLPRNKKNYTNLWTIYMMIPKLHGVVLFQCFLLAMTMDSSMKFVDSITGQGIVIWCIAAGSIIGCFLLRFFQSAKVYTLTSVIGVVALGVCYAFFKVEYTSLVVLLWVYFFFASLVVSVPDLVLMEISKIRFCEGALAVGYFVEIIPLAVLQSLFLTDFDWFNENNFLPYIIANIVVLVVSSVLYQLHMPNTFSKSLLQIQNELLKYKKYFVFDFDFEVNSKAPRDSSGSSQYMSDAPVNVFENHANNISNDAKPNDYVEVMERLPDPPVNRAKNFDYYNDIPKPPAIIPRVNIAKSQPNSPYYH